MPRSATLQEGGMAMELKLAGSLQCNGFQVERLKALKVTFKQIPHDIRMR